jgi:transposase
MRFVAIKSAEQQSVRRLLVIGMTSQLQSARRKPEVHPWITNLLVSKPNKLVAVAMANKAARIAWVIMTRGEAYRAHRPATEETA